MCVYRKVAAGYATIDENKALLMQYNNKLCAWDDRHAVYEATKRQDRLQVLAITVESVQ